MKDIAIVGASGQIGKSLALKLAVRYNILLFSRKPDKLDSILTHMGLPKARISVLGYDKLSDTKFDMVINAAGFGDPGLLRELENEIGRITERIDRLILSCMTKSPDAIYLFFSTGAIYGNNYHLARSRCQKGPISPTKTSLGAYVKAKLATESRHREQSDKRIVDVRLFGYLSQFLPIDSSFFLAQALLSLVRGELFKVSADNFIRDFIGPDELSVLVDCLFKVRAQNQALDIFSSAPISKATILDKLAERYGLRYKGFNNFENAETSQQMAIPRRISWDKTGEEMGLTIKKSSAEILTREFDLLAENYNIPIKC